ncbi:MAG: hypothetical protein F4Y88_03300 [Chloroflexi bacterium]|nr:hypothetical protein [Chloroflexota bacterium]
MEPRSPEYLRNLVRELCALPSETEWVEFKENNADPASIGKNISALSNGAALHDRPSGYLVWGIDDDPHQIVGTNFSLEPDGIGPQEPRIRASVSDNCDFQFHNVDVDNQQVVVLEINPARQYPVRFNREPFIRVGSATKRLRDVAQIEVRLWRILNQSSFEDNIADANVTGDRVLQLLDCPSYFKLLRLPLPDGNQNILETLRSEGLIRRSDAGGWDITNLAALLLAHDLREFRRLARKRVRVIGYDGSGRFDPARERQFDLGYASTFQQVIEHIMALVPSNEIIEQALNVALPM